jgi:hypothetical protein
VVNAAAERIIGLYEEFLDPNTQLPIRLTGSKEVLKASRESLMLRPERDPLEDPLDFDYDALPYSPTENHKLIQLQKFQQYLPLLMEAPNVNKEKLVLKLLDLLGMQDLAEDTPQAPPQPPGGMPGAAPPMPPGMLPGMPPAGMQPPAVDSAAGGGLPQGTEAPPQIPLPAGGPGLPT